MTIEVDIDKLKSRQAELEAELTRISGLLTLAEQFSKLAPITPAPTQAALPLAPANGHPVPAPKPDIKHRGFTPGLRRAVTMALYSGPATESDLARYLAWDISRVRNVLCAMLKYRICYLNEHGRLQLSDDGKKQAA